MASSYWNVPSIQIPIPNFTQTSKLELSTHIIDLELCQNSNIFQDLVHWAGHQDATSSIIYCLLHFFRTYAKCSVLWMVSSKIEN